MESAKETKEKSQDILGKVRATPAARKIARDNELDLFQIRGGTGPNERIQKKLMWKII